MKLEVTAAGGGHLAVYTADEYDGHDIHPSGAVVVRWHGGDGDHVDTYSFGTWSTLQQSP